MITKDEIRFIQKEPCRDESAHLYTLVYKFFSPVTRYFYILRADYHEDDFFAIKFYCKKDRRSDNRYSKIINKGDIGNIIITCAKIVPFLLIDYPNASFGIAGARTIDPLSKTIETYDNNQRFRLYITPKKIGQKTFAHFTYKEISGYLLINRKSSNIIRKERELRKMLVTTYSQIHDM